jgi:putative membrane protein
VADVNPRSLGFLPRLVGVLAMSMIAAGVLWSGSFAPLAGMTKQGMQTPLYAIAVLLISIGLFACFAVISRFV